MLEQWYAVIMPESYPPDVRQFLEEQLASGEYHTEEELLVEALRTLRVVADHHRRLHVDVQMGLIELDQGKGESWDVDSLKNELGQQLDTAS